MLSVYAALQTEVLIRWCYYDLEGEGNDTALIS